MKEVKFKSMKKAGLFLKEKIEQDLQNKIVQQGEAVLILPGGQSIKSFFPFLISLNVRWDKITIGLSDERCVPIDHELNNERQLKEYFLNHIEDARYCPLGQVLLDKIQEHSPITILSMGTDGHLASLFPRESKVWKLVGMSIYQTIWQKPNRISLTEKALLLSEKIYILVIGNEKCLKFENIKNSSYCLNSIFKYSTMIKF